ncbi:dehydrogenase [Sorangium cellulosum]|uniref:Dehydrogenase n=1 Tax=Sorangium cellulosum TaxID=56 RepID=A0A2L0F1V2_SORCE|nr:zinc-binding alcohol dehydrogenase [Sorangium cellulosum]AUX45513.1 dehydrogenase [Sorangium cellulosum]
MATPTDAAAPPPHAPAPAPSGVPAPSDAPAPPPRELWFVRPRVVEVRPGAPPGEPGAGEVVARALASGVSQGTELLLYRGEGPTPFDPSLDPPGAPTYPRRYGYAWVGEVVARGEGAALAPGDRVFALAPHGEVHRLGPGAARALPRAVPSERAVLAANLETAITCVWDAGVGLGDAVVVLGGGVVGLLVVALARRAGATVRLVEPSERRRKAGLALGAAAAVRPDEDRPRGDADVVIAATGDPAELDRAIAHAAREATVTVASFYGARTSPVALGAEFHRRRLRLRASQVSSIPPERAARWDHTRRFALVCALLEDAALDALLDPPVPFDEAPAVYQKLAEEPGARLQTVLCYGPQRVGAGTIG